MILSGRGWIGEGRESHVVKHSNQRGGKWQGRSTLLLRGGPGATSSYKKAPQDNSGHLEVRRKDKFCRNRVCHCIASADGHIGSQWGGRGERRLRIRVRADGWRAEAASGSVSNRQWAEP